jgi:predicted NBD/HSP70 family sugar kinase
VLFREGPIARRQLRSALGSSSSTATEVVHALLARGLIVETGTTASTGGRPAKVLDLSSSLGLVLAADVGATNTRVGAGSLRGEILARRTMPTPATGSPEALQRVLVEGLEHVHQQAGGGQVRALVIALAGIVDPDNGSILTTTVPDWGAMDLDVLLDWMRAQFEGYPLLLENEANLAALGEHQHGIARGARDVMFVAVGAGVGAGLVLNGSLFRGFRGAAGEIGYMRLASADGQLELDQLGGADALVRRFLQAGGSSDARTAEAVFIHAAAGDESARVAISEVLDDLAMGIANAIALLDPQKVVIGGGLAEAGAVFIDPLRTRIRQLALVPEMPELVPSQLGWDAALVGGIYLACEHAREAISAELEISA